jgi:plasmid stability protein
MATLHVRNVPEPLYEALRERASERRTSISAEAVRLLERAIRVDRAGVGALLAEVEAGRAALRRGAPSPAALIREDRNGRRR